MTITYCRNDPVSGRWSGVNRLLTEFEADFNVYQHETRIATLESNAHTTVSIDTITAPTPDTLLFTMTDSTTRGPFVIPTALFNPRGTWATSTAYAVNDTFDINGVLYLVIFAHTSSATSFSPTANDGAGHNYYAALLTLPGNSLPTGGATAQVLQKSSSSDYAVTWGYKLPTGGTTYQVLLKQSSTNQDAAWATLGATMVSFTPSTASGLTSTNVAAALEEIEANITSSGGLLPANNLSDVASASTARTNLGLEIGTDVQAYDAQLSSLVRQNSQSLSYTLVLTDGGKHIFHPDGDTTARTFTIPDNASVGFPVGTVITFVNGHGAGIVTIAITTDTMRLSPGGTTGSRTLAADGMATALKISSTEWKISGTGLT